MKTIQVKLKGEHDEMARRYEVILINGKKEKKLGLVSKPLYRGYNHKTWIAFRPGNYVREYFDYRVDAIEFLIWHSLRKI